MYKILDGWENGQNINNYVKNIIKIPDINGQNNNYILNEKYHTFYTITTIANITSIVSNIPNVIIAPSVAFFSFLYI